MYKVGIAGLGNIASLFDEDEKTRIKYKYITHAGTYTQHPETEIVAGCDIDPERRKKFIEKYNNVKLYDDYKEMLKEVEIDILSICTWPETHYEIAKYAAENGVKAIFCEKPLATNLKDAMELNNLCKEKKIPLIVNYWRRYDDSHQALKHYINAGKIGEVQQVFCLYGNGIYNNASHIINLLIQYFSGVDWVSAWIKGNREKKDPDIDLMLHFKKGINAFIASCDFKYYRIIEIDILGTKGRIHITNEGLDISLYGVRENSDVSGAYELYPVDNPSESTVGTALYNVVDSCVRSLKKDSVQYGEDGVETIAIIEAAMESSKRNGEKIFLKEASNIDEK